MSTSKACAINWFYHLKFGNSGLFSYCDNLLLAIDDYHFNFIIKLFKAACQGALVKWLWEEIHVPKVVGSNPSTAYWMDIFTFIWCKNCNVSL